LIAFYLSFSGGGFRKTQTFDSSIQTENMVEETKSSIEETERNSQPFQTIRDKLKAEMSNNPGNSIETMEKNVQEVSSAENKEMVDSQYSKMVSPNKERKEATENDDACQNHPKSVYGNENNDDGPKQVINKVNSDKEGQKYAKSDCNDLGHLSGNSEGIKGDKKEEDQVNIEQTLSMGNRGTRKMDKYQNKVSTKDKKVSPIGHLSGEGVCNMLYGKNKEDIDNMDYMDYLDYMNSFAGSNEDTRGSIGLSDSRPSKSLSSRRTDLSEHTMGKGRYGQRPIMSGEVGRNLPGKYCLLVRADIPATVPIGMPGTRPSTKRSDMSTAMPRNICGTSSNSEKSGMSAAMAINVAGSNLTTTKPEISPEAGQAMAGIGKMTKLPDQNYPERSRLLTQSQKEELKSIESLLSKAQNYFSTSEIRKPKSVSDGTSV